MSRSDRAVQTASLTEQMAGLASDLADLLNKYKDDYPAILADPPGEDAILLVLGEFLENAREMQAREDAAAVRNAGVYVLQISVDKWTAGDSFRCQATDCETGEFVPPKLTCPKCGQRHEVFVPLAF